MEMKTNPLRVLVDGSNDNLTVKVYDHSRKQAVIHLLNMCTTTGSDCGTSLAILIFSVLQSHGVTVLDLELITPVLVKAI